MQFLITFLKSKYFVWLIIFLLGAEALLMLFFEFPYRRRVFKEIMEESGELSIRLMILAMLVSPLRRLFSDNLITRWLVRNRRGIGVGAFCYALVHVFAYLVYEHLPEILDDLTDIRYIAGWIAFIIFIPLAITSANWAVRALGGKRWKMLHRALYVAAIAAALHWFLLPDNDAGDIITHFTPLFLLEMYRVYRWRQDRKKLKTT